MISESAPPTETYKRFVMVQKYGFAFHCSIHNCTITALYKLLIKLMHIMHLPLKRRKGYP